MLLSAIAFFSDGGNAIAAETVLLRYKTITTTLPIEDIETFATTGETSTALQTFLGQTSLSTDLMATLLADEIPDTGIPLGPTDIQFLLFQLNKLIGDPLERENLDSLGRALLSAFLDKNMSVLELVKRYPESTVRLDLGRLSQVHRDIDLFVRRLSTLFSFFEELLPDLVCECDETVSDSEENFAIAPVQSESCEIFQKERAVRDSLTPKDAIELSQSPTLLSPFRPPRTAEEVIFIFGPLRFNFSIADLTTFVETGQVPKGWRFTIAQEI